MLGIGQFSLGYEMQNSFSWDFVLFERWRVVVLFLYLLALCSVVSVDTI
jgi:hypothetical protein